MELSLTAEMRELMVDRGHKDKAFVDDDNYRWGTTIEYDDLSEAQRTDLLAVTEELRKQVLPKGDKKTVNHTYRLLKSALRASVTGKTIDLQVMVESMRKALLTETKSNYLFGETDDGHLLPYLVDAVTYHPAERRSDWYRPAYGEISLRYLYRGHGKSKRVTFHRENLKHGISVDELLTDLGYTVETEDLIEQHTKSLNRYVAVRDSVGEQYLCHGTGKKCKDESGSDYYRWWYQDRMYVVGHAHDPARVVVDDEEDRGKMGTGKKVLRGKSLKNDWTDAEEEGAVSVVPCHPYIRIFDFDIHNFATVHIDTLEPYEYDVDLYDKLVLPRTMKQLMEVLVLSAVSGSDLVRNKGRGSVILASGKPGTGKTLTAEVFSERAKMPLYSVQCSQLGVDPEQLERNLRVILNNAERWNALLLLDEADVFIRERTDDLVHNAVVGVFLRLLEYYEGVMVLTTNRESVIDDAIRSRCIAHFRYELPSADDRMLLWELFTKQFGVEVSPKLLKTLALDFEISGRSIRAACRLASTISGCSTRKLDVEVFTWLINQLDVDGLPHQDGLDIDITFTAPRRRRERLRLKDMR